MTQFETSGSYRGKVKEVEFLDEEKVRITFTNDITAGDGAKKDNIEGKGAMNLKLSNIIMDKLEAAGISTHVIEKESENTIIAKNLKIFPLEVVVRNVAAGSFRRRYGLEEGSDLPKPLVEYFVKDDELHDPLIDGRIAVDMGMVTQYQLDFLKARAKQVNNVMKEYFEKADMLLVDFKLEFGYDINGDIFLADEVSADAMRVWDIETREKLDKDRFRKDLGDVLAGYQVIIDRLEKVDFEPTEEDMKVRIDIEPKEGINNPSGDVTKRSLINAGLENIGDVEVGKSIYLTVNDTTQGPWLKKLEEVTENILSNPLIEEYSIHFL